jgi:hypothetical protein
MASTDWGFSQSSLGGRVHRSIMWAKQVVERHGGEISINSAPGRGTSVVLSLPPRRSLVRRLQDGIALSLSSRETYCQGGAKGYVDYPVAS